MLWRRKSKRGTSKLGRQETGRKPHVETLESRVVLSSGAAWSGFEIGGFCTPVPAALAAPSAEAEFSPQGKVASRIAAPAADPQTGNPYHNARLPADVDDNGVITTADVGALIAKFNEVFDLDEPLTMPPTFGVPGTTSANDAIYWDVNNDERLTPLDLLVVVNEVNRLLPSPDEVQMQVATAFGYTYVIVNAPLSTGVSIGDYGEVDYQGDTFFVNATAHEAAEDCWSQDVCRTKWTYFYGLGELAPGTYRFHLSINGRPMRSETFSIADTQRPQGTLSVVDVTAPTDWHTFAVTYTDNHAVQLASLDDDDVVVTGPNGYREKAALVSVDADADSSSCTVTYRIPAPSASRDWSGNWNWPANGKYEVWLEGDQVWDTSHNAAEATCLGTFWVDVLQWTSYVPSWADVQMIVGIQYTKAHVELTFADTGYRVADWGRAVRQGNSFAVAANVERDVTGIHAQVLTYDSHDYDLGELEPGDYSFRFLVHGQLVQQTRFTVLDNDLPRAILNASDLWEAGGEDYRFTMTCTDLTAIDAATLDDHDVVVTGPNEFRQEAALVMTENSGDKHWLATYQIAAPGGVWDDSDAGIYKIQMLDNAVLDIHGRPAEPGVLGGFAFMPDGSSVATAPYAPQTADVTITPVSHGLQSGLPSVFRVDLNLPYPGYRVADWGQMTRHGDMFTVDVDIQRVPGVEQDQAELRVWHEYDVTDWPLGGCIFVFRVHGRMIRIEGFPTPAHVKHALQVMTAGVASGSELPDNPFAESVFVTDRNADAAALAAFPFLPDSNDGFLDALAQDLADRYRDSGEALPEDALFRLLDELWNLPV